MEDVECAAIVTDRISGRRLEKRVVVAANKIHEVFNRILRYFGI
jgi:hypothetical protein